MNRIKLVGITVFGAGAFGAMVGAWSSLKGVIPPLWFGLGMVLLTGLASGFAALSGFFHENKVAGVTNISVNGKQ